MNIGSVKIKTRLLIIYGGHVKKQKTFWSMIKTPVQKILKMEIEMKLGVFFFLLRLRGKELEKIFETLVLHMLTAARLF